MKREPDDILLSLRRTDKHCLGDGAGLIFAPPHPRWLQRPGFWDGVQLFMQILRPAFTFTILDAAGREVPLIHDSVSWTPDCLEVAFTAGELRVVERRVVLDRAAASVITLLNRGSMPIDSCLAAWTVVESSQLHDRSLCRATEDGVAFRTAGSDAQLRPHSIPLDARLRLEPLPDSTLLLESQYARAWTVDPAWAVTPFRDLAPIATGVTARLATEPPAGRTVVFLGLVRQLRLEPGASREITVHMDVEHADPALARRAAVPVAGYAGAVAGPSDRGRQAATPAHLAYTDVRADVRSRDSWRRFFAQTPSIRSSDPFIERFFDYRWFGLRLNFLDPAGRHEWPTCAEGTDFFHDAVSYSAWCHARELRWLPDPARARGVIRTFLDRQREDGSIPGILWIDGEHETASYFADWGGSVLAVDQVHPDRAFLEEAYTPLCRYADHLDRTRDAEGTGLFRVLDPYETGQETMSRYTAVDTASDRHHFEYRLDLFGVDITVYAYRLRRSLARIARLTGRTADAPAHDNAANRTANAVRNRMWDADAGLFFDIDPRTGARTGVRAAVCLYPWWTGIPGEAHVAGIERNLTDPNAFGTPFPVPSTAVSDPTFDPVGYWKGVRQNCPWNGRVWPMANCHVAEALARQATTFAPALRHRAGSFIASFVRMMFFDGDPGRPNSFEHYSPLTGRPGDWRGLDDYQHSWINDLIIRWIVGFRPAPDGFIVDPLPAGIESIALDGLPFRGREVSLEIDGHRIRASVDGTAHSSTDGPLHVPVPA